MTPGDAGVICGAMERDAQRADRILEGAPVGVMIRMRDDPSTLVNFCCGTGVPSPHPDTEPTQHYTSCPIYAADREVQQVEDRAFALKREATGFTPDPELVTGVDAAREWDRAMREAGEL